LIKVYGSSDDLIEIDGDIYEEFNTDAGILLFSDGTLLQIHFNTLGLWKINVHRQGDAHIHWAHVASNPNSDNHSDVVHLIGGNIEFVALVEQMAWALTPSSAG
jgi:hypothetical protein